MRAIDGLFACAAAVSYVLYGPIAAAASLGDTGILRSGYWALLLLLFSAAGCGLPPRQQPDSAQQRWEETARRCRGELLLVKARGDGSSAASVPPGVIEKARAFTVAVRARTSSLHADATSTALTANHASGPLGMGVTSGTGVILDERGSILTNEHVIDGAGRIDVCIAGQGWRTAGVVGTDPQTGLAVIRIGAKPSMYACLGDADALRIGHAVVALGYPAGTPSENPAAFTGHISSPQRSLQGALDPTQNRFYAGLVESTASIPPGCSGGPLLDGDGRVIGINTAAATDARTGRQLGYAIPLSGHTRSIIDQLVHGRSVEHGYLGLLVRASGDGGSADDAGPSPGAIVERVIPGSPADLAGIRPNDVVTRVGENVIKSAGQLAEAVRATPVGAGLEIQVQRSGRVIMFNAAVASRPGPQA